jgi:hypothetical protein
MKISCEIFSYSWYDKIALEKMYVVKATHVQESLRKYADVNKVEIRCNKVTVILPTEDDNDIPLLDFNFSSIAEIEQMPKDSLVGT